MFSPLTVKSHNLLLLYLLRLCLHAVSSCQYPAAINENSSTHVSEYLVGVLLFHLHRDLPGYATRIYLQTPKDSGDGLFWLWFPTGGESLRWSGCRCSLGGFSSQWGFGSNWSGFRCRCRFSCCGSWFGRRGWCWIIIWIWKHMQQIAEDILSVICELNFTLMGSNDISELGYDIFVVVLKNTT